MNKKICVLFVIWFSMGIFCAQANAATMRYALIVGNNTGVDNDGTTPFMPLKHAEKEARKLKHKLIGLSNFAPDAKRTLLLTSVSKHDVRRAITRLVVQKKKDEALLGKMESIFLFYFTGHGLQGRLLMEDGALYSKEIGQMFEKVDADFAVGIFDACHSGSLSPKGVVPTPGLNMFKEMPKEVLNAKGRIWYVSSSAKQVSYEDNRIGGVFTHFFMEALTDAPQSGPGITLDSIWNYAREKTVKYTASQNKMQVPQQYISNLKSSAPVFFSFPKKRTATMYLSESLYGRFALSYAGGQLIEIITKKEGKRKRVALYSGDITMSYIQNDELVHVKTFHVENGGELYLRSPSDFEGGAPVGHRNQTLWAKGDVDMPSMELRRQSPSASLMTGISYGYGIATNGVLAAGHMISVPIRLDLASIYLVGTVGYVSENWDYPTWGYNTNGFLASANAAWSIDFSSNRIGLGVDFEYMLLWQYFNTGEQRRSNSYSPAARATLLLRKNKAFSASVYMRTGAVYSQAASNMSQYYWAFTAGAGMSIYFRVL